MANNLYTFPEELIIKDYLHMYYVYECVNVSGIDIIQNMFDYYPVFAEYFKNENPKINDLKEDDDKILCHLKLLKKRMYTRRGILTMKPKCLNTLVNLVNQMGIILIGLRDEDEYHIIFMHLKKFANNPTMDKINTTLLQFAEKIEQMYNNYINFIKLPPVFHIQIEHYKYQMSKHQNNTYELLFNFINKLKYIASIQKYIDSIQIITNDILTKILMEYLIDKLFD